MALKALLSEYNSDFTLLVVIDFHEVLKLDDVSLLEPSDTLALMSCSSFDSMLVFLTIHNQFREVHHVTMQSS